MGPGQDFFGGNSADNQVPTVLQGIAFPHPGREPGYQAASGAPGLPGSVSY